MQRQSADIEAFRRDEALEIPADLDLDKVGGVQLVMKRLLEAGLLHGDEMTVTGKTIKENLKNIDINPKENNIVRLIDNPISKTGGLVTLFVI